MNDPSDPDPNFSEKLDRIFEIVQRPIVAWTPLCKHSEVYTDNEANSRCSDCNKKGI